MQNKTEPALVLLYGSTEQRRRALRRDVTILGRGRNADWVLNAPDISQIHCVIWRQSNRFLVRDCGSRTGTRLNGDHIEEATLHDGDILHVGMFSFGLELPNQPECVNPADRKLVKLRRSRENLARLALSYRQKWLKQRVASRVEQDLHRKASALRDRVRLYDDRLKKLQENERDIAMEREKLEQERQILLQAKKACDDLAKPSFYP